MGPALALVFGFSLKNDGWVELSKVRSCIPGLGLVLGFMVLLCYCETFGPSLTLVAQEVGFRVYLCSSGLGSRICVEGGNKHRALP